MLYSLKNKYQILAKNFIYQGLTANQATILGWVFVLLSSSALLAGTETLPLLRLIFPILMLFRFIFNALDGLIARKNNQASAMGELVNEISDIWGDTIIFGILFFTGFVNPLYLCAFLICCWFAEFVGMLGRALPPHQRQHASLLGGKSERGLFLSLYIGASYFNPALLTSMNSFILILTLVTRSRPSITL
jgi:phosphatidylglycerophosphate synthase